MEKVISKDGTPIAYQRAGNGPTLILVHGSCVDHNFWTSVQGSLATKCTLLMVDRRGRGESGDSASYQIDREIEDISSVADSVIGSSILLGHSYGGICALEVASQSRKLRGLILYEPPILLERDIHREDVIRNMKGLIKAGDNDGVASTFFREVLNFSPDQIAQLRSTLMWRGAVAIAHTIIRELETCTTQYKFERERFSRLDIPVLLLIGGDSPEFYQGTSINHCGRHRPLLLDTVLNA